jgi:hypothetical protein
MASTVAPGCPVHADFDPLSPRYLEDPFAVLRELPAGEAPVFYAPAIDYYVVTPRLVRACFAALRGQLLIEGRESAAVGARAVVRRRARLGARAARLCNTSQSPARGWAI